MMHIWNRLLAYRGDRVLGQGGMGVVVQAMHLQLHQPVAMKFLLPEVLVDPQVVQRFLREAQAVARLKSEHITRVIDVGALDDGAPYMVLEYLDGSDLADFSRQQLTIGQIVDLMLQACEALAEAHSIGIDIIANHKDGLTRGATGMLYNGALRCGCADLILTGLNHEALHRKGDCVKLRRST